MEEIEIEEPEQMSLAEIFNGTPCPKCGREHTYTVERLPYRILCTDCMHQWSLVEDMK